MLLEARRVYRRHGDRTDAFAGLEDPIESGTFREVFEDVIFVLRPGRAHLLRLQVAGRDDNDDVVGLGDAVQQLGKDAILLCVYLDDYVDAQVKDADAVLRLGRLYRGIKRQQKIVESIRVILLERVGRGRIRKMQTS